MFLQKLKNNCGIHAVQRLGGVGGYSGFYALFFHLTKFTIMALPKEIRTDHYFMGSVFKNSECETILRNIVMLQKKTNQEAWTSFSWDDYKAFCTHNVTESERGVLNAFVNGGKSVWNTTTYQSAGWLDFDGSKYSFTAKMIDMLSENYSIYSMA